MMAGTSPRARQELLGRVLVTALAVAAYVLLARIPLPLVDREPFEALVPRPATLGMFGLEPFLGAYVLVELVALAVPALRRRRHGDAAARAPLARAAWVLALVLVVAQVAAFLATVRGLRVTGGAAVVAGGGLGLLAVGVSAVAGAALTVALARWIDRRGLVSGFAVLLVAGMIASYLRQPGALLALDPSPAPLVPLHAMEAYAIPLAVRSADDPAPWVVAWLPAAAALGLVGAWTAWLLRRRARPGPTVPAPTCGLVPFAALAAVLAEVPAASAPQQGWAVPAVWSVAALLASAFSRRGPVQACWAAAGVDPTAAAAPLRRAHVRTALWIGALALSPLALAAFPAGHRLRPAVLVDVAVLVAVALDLAAELRDRARTPGLVPAYPLHRVHAVDPALTALAAGGIPAAARARYFRALFHFFAPYAPVELLVAPDRLEEASAICGGVACGAHPSAARPPRVSPPSPPR